MDKADKKQPRTFWKARGCFCFTGSSLPQGGQARREKLYQLGQILLLAGIQPLLQVGPVTNSCMEMSFLSVFNALLLYHSQQVLSQRKKGLGPLPCQQAQKSPGGQLCSHSPGERMMIDGYLWGFSTRIDRPM